MSRKKKFWTIFVVANLLIPTVALSRDDSHGHASRTIASAPQPHELSMSEVHKLFFDFEPSVDSNAKQLVIAASLPEKCADHFSISHATIAGSQGQVTVTDDGEGASCIAKARKHGHDCNHGLTCTVLKSSTDLSSAKDHLHFILNHEDKNRVSGIASEDLKDSSGSALDYTPPAPPAVVTVVVAPDKPVASADQASQEDPAVARRLKIMTEAARYYGVVSHCRHTTDQLDMARTALGKLCNLPTIGDDDSWTDLESNSFDRNAQKNIDKARSLDCDELDSQLTKAEFDDFVRHASSDDLDSIDRLEKKVAKWLDDHSDYTNDAAKKIYSTIAERQRELGTFDGDDAATDTIAQAQKLEGLKADSKAGLAKDQLLIKLSRAKLDTQDPQLFMAGGFSSDLKGLQDAQINACGGGAHDFAGLTLYTYNGYSNDSLRAQSSTECRDAKTVYNYATRVLAQQGYQQYQQTMQQEQRAEQQQQQQWYMQQQGMMNPYAMPMPGYGAPYSGYNPYVIYN